MNKTEEVDIDVLVFRAAAEAVAATVLGQEIEAVEILTDEHGVHRYECRREDSRDRPSWDGMLADFAGRQASQGCYPEFTAERRMECTQCLASAAVLQQFCAPDRTFLEDRCLEAWGIVEKHFLAIDRLARLLVVDRRVSAKVIRAVIGD